MYEYILKPGDLITFYPVEKLLTYKKDGRPIWTNGVEGEAPGTICPDFPSITPIYSPYMLQDYHKVASEFIEVKEVVGEGHIYLYNHDWAWPLCCVSHVRPVGTSDILQCVPFFGEDFRTKLFIEEAMPKVPRPTVRYLRIL